MFVRVAARLVEMQPSVDFFFRVIGDGSLTTQIRRLAKIFGIENRFAFDGWIDADDVLPYLASQVDLVLHTHFEETFCITNVQAMATQRPLITFGTAGVTEYLRRGDVHGVIVVDTAPTPEAMARRVVSLLRHPRVARAIGKAGAEEIWSQDYSISATGKRYARLYEGLVDGRGHAE